MEAADAVADANLPQTAAVDTSNFQQPQVAYDGDPNFVSVPNTGCSYAVNCGTPIVSCNGTYYCCDDAVWYQAGVPIGPWAVCRHVPHEIYTLPPSCPIYGVTFCHVFGFTPSVVYVGYFPGYVGCYAFNGVIVYGTGYHYAPWIGHRYFSRRQRSDSRQAMTLIRATGALMWRWPAVVEAVGSVEFTPLRVAGGAGSAMAAIGRLCCGPMCISIQESFR